MNIIIAGPLFNQASICAPILRSLPQWFGIEPALVQYLENIDAMPGFIARIDNSVAGFLVVKHNYQNAAEIYVMGVQPERHRRGIGKMLLTKTEDYLKQTGIEFLQVKTLGPSRQNEAYARTRAFYFAVGFRPLEELKTVWGPENPCLMMIKSLTISSTMLT